MKYGDYREIYNIVIESEGYYTDGCLWVPQTDILPLVIPYKDEGDLTPIIDIEFDKLSSLKKWQYHIIQTCIERYNPGVEYADAILLFDDIYKKSMWSYMFYNMTYTNSIYPVRFGELQVIAQKNPKDYILALQPNMDCVNDKEQTIDYNYVHVEREGYIKIVTKDNKRLFDPEVNDICFLINLDMTKKYKDVINGKKGKGDSVTLNTTTHDLDKLKDIILGD